MATHFNILAWEIPWTKEPEGLQSTVLQKSQTWLACVCVCVCVLVPQSCPTLWDPMDCYLPGTSVSGALQARILEWVALPFSKGSSRSRDQTQVSCIAGRCFTVWATREAHLVTKQQQFWCITDVFNSRWQHAKEEKVFPSAMTYRKLTSSLSF